MGVNPQQVCVVLPNVGSHEAPAVPAVNGGGHAALLHNITSAEKGASQFLETMAAWNRPCGMRYCLPLGDADLACDDVALSSLLRAMINAGATSAAGGVFTAATTDDAGILQSLAAQDFVHEVDGGWVISDLGMVSLSYKHMLSEPRLLTDLPSTTVSPLADWSTFHLLVALKQRGWTWKPLPRNIQDRSSLRYPIPLTDDADDANRCWYR